MKYVRVCIAVGISFLVFFAVYGKWFGLYPIIGGDWPYTYSEYLRQFTLWPTLWASWAGNGFGMIHPVLGLYAFHSFLVVFFTQWLRLPWEWTYKVFWFGLFLFTSIFSIRALLRQIDAGITPPFIFLGALIYSTNTYVVMMTSGGQMGVALAYSIAPLVLSLFIKLIDSTKGNGRYSQFAIRNSLAAGCILGIQILWDSRLAYMTLMAVGLYLLFRRKHMLFVFGACVIAVLLNAFWILPFAVLRNNPLESLGSAYTTVAALKFFSFADFSHTLSLLHPNWPENIFGKTFFLQPEFLLIPIIAFSGFLFSFNSKKAMKGEIRNSQFLPAGRQGATLFFALLALVSVFLAKGSNPPFGDVYVWLFEHVPGFVVFRDSTKFYMLIALSYSVLIPMSMMGFVSRMKEKKKVLFLDTSYLILIPFLLFWLFTIRQAVTGSIGGTFVRHEVPQEYNQLKDMLVADTSFSRTLWVPRQSRFTYFDALHPSVEATPLLGATNAAELRRAFAAPDAEQKFARLGIGRVFVEYDALGELFLNDRKYDDGVREEWLAVLDEVPWLTRVQDGKVAMYETPTHNDLFWTVTREPLMYRQIGPSHYLVTIASQNQNVPLYFSQAFHPGWVATYAGKQVHAVKTEDNLIQFVLPTADGGALDVYFAPQRYVDYGMIISICTFAGSVLGMVLVGRLIGRV